MEEEEEEGPQSRDTEIDSLCSCVHIIYPQYVVTVCATSRGAAFLRHLLISLTHPIYATVVFHMHQDETFIF